MKQLLNLFAVFLALGLLISCADGGGGHGGGGGGQAAVGPGDGGGPVEMGTISVTVKWPAGMQTQSAGFQPMFIPTNTEWIRGRVKQTPGGPNVFFEDISAPSGTCTPSPCTTTTLLSVPANLTYDIGAVAMAAGPASPYRKPVLLASGTADGNPIAVAPGPQSVSVHLNQNATCVSGGVSSGCVASSVTLTSTPSVPFPYGSMPVLQLTFTAWPADVTGAAVDFYYVYSGYPSFTTIPTAPVCSFSDASASCASQTPLSGGVFVNSTGTDIAFLAQIDGSAWATGSPLSLLQTGASPATTHFDVLSGVYHVEPSLGRIDVIVD